MPCRLAPLLLLLAASVGAQLTEKAPASDSNADAIANLAAGLIGLVGLVAWVSPLKSLEAYGLADRDASALAFMRVVGAYQLQLAATFLAGKAGAKSAAAYSLWAAALAILANIVVYEYFARPKLGSVNTAVIFGVLGRFILDGRASPYWAVGFLLLVGSLIHLAPKSTTELYELQKPVSPCGHSMLALSGGTILTAGALVLAQASGLSPPRSLAAALACYALIVAKWSALEAAALGAPMGHSIAGAVVLATLAAAAISFAK